MRTSGNQISKRITLAAQKTGVDLHAHSLRYYFVARLVDRGVDIETIRQLMGHSHLIYTQRYMPRADRRKRDAISRLIDPKR